METGVVLLAKIVQKNSETSWLYFLGDHVSRNNTKKDNKKKRRH